MSSVYFSDILPSKFKMEWASIKNTLLSKGVKISLLKRTKDIWCRDYMPVKDTNGELIQFRYEPSYLKDYPNLQTKPDEVLKSNGIKATYSRINLDGGNVIINGRKAIITDRAVLENPEYSNKFRMFKEIEELLNAELIVVPAHKPKNDMTGHIDGMMRFVDNTTLLGNDLNGEFNYMADKIKRILKENSLDYIPMPIYQDNTTPISAKGTYVNYLEIDNTIIFPIFEQKEIIDKVALEVIVSTFPSKEVIPININSIAKEGGLMNCISWEY